MNSPIETSISVDWEKIWHFLFRLTTGVGLILFWLALLAITAGILIWIGVFIVKLPFAGILGIGITIPIILCCWWLSYYIAIDFLSEIGIELNGLWQWIILPIALPLAPISFLMGFISGLGELVKGRTSTVLSCSLGAFALIALFIFVIRVMA